ncbi:hypothetical protein [Embleya sp. NPDC005971]|uniref:hypothetical protein n=1 Tax=Embleya sp. NPDC005971 TaxID=3156724 RepID=UPI0033E49C22
MSADVDRFGPRDLTREVHDALVAWEQVQRPRLWDFHATVTPHETTHRVGRTDRPFARDPDPNGR